MRADTPWPAAVADEWAPLLGEATRSLTSHRLRTALSIVGVIAAVATIVTCAAIVEGGRREALAAVSALGERNVIVRAADTAATVDIEDVRAVAMRLPGVSDLAATRISHLDLMSDGSRMEGIVVGVTLNWRHVSNLRLATGRWFNNADMSRHSRTAILGAGAADRLSAGSPVIGRLMKAGDEWFTVIGVLEPQARAGAAQRFDIDHAALVPFPAASGRADVGDAPGRAHEVIVSFVSASFVERAAPRVLALNDRNRSDRPALEIVIPREILRARLATRRSFDLTLLGVGVVSLIISGVAIMNIMLVSVAERTQEIGTRRACGARRSHIMRQFTVEAAMLTIAGAIGGTITGVLSASALAWLGWSIAFSVTALTLSWLLVAMTGLACGLYPAHRAATLMPGDALRVA